MTQATIDQTSLSPNENVLWIASDLNLREYQQKIVDRAQKEHLLVVIPTGLGKTLIGAKLMDYCMTDTDLRKKAIFLAPTRPLIDQHVQSLRSYFNTDLVDIFDITGKVSPAKRTKIITSEKPALIVMTPQTLNNDIAKERYSLENICLIIFDEAHRAQGKYAYVPIANKFVNDNPQGRILALTASPGSTKEKISTLLQNLHIPLGHIEYRDRQHKEVKPYTHEITVSPTPVEMTPLMTEIYGILEGMKNETLEQYDKIYLDIDPKAPQSPEGYYLSTIIKQMKFLVSQINHRETAPNRNPKTLRTLLSMNARINKIYHLLEYVESQGLENVRLALEKMGKKIEKGTASHADVFLFRDYRIQRIFEGLNDLNQKDPEQLRHPKQLEIQKILRTAFTENPGARILIFTKYRDTVRNMVKYLKTTLSICHPSKFVGQSKKSKQDKGMSQKKQLEILGKFRNGEINTLVATNVAEEGLDIAECSMVIMYDTLASEIRMIQRAGRTGRSSAGEIKVLFTKGTSDERKWYIAQARTKRMKKECNASPHIAPIPKANIGKGQKILEIPPKPEKPKPKMDKKVIKLPKKFQDSPQTLRAKPQKIEDKKILELKSPSPPVLPVAKTETKFYITDSIEGIFNEVVSRMGCPITVPRQKIGLLIIQDKKTKVGFDFFSLKELTIKDRRALFLNEIQQKNKTVSMYHCFLDGTSVAKSEIPKWVEIVQHIEKTLGIRFHFYLTKKTAQVKFKHLIEGVSRITLEPINFTINPAEGGN
ncbi:MAG: DEAD/DEAH box helicase family protein [Promethearchaeota archaeon]